MDGQSVNAPPMAEQTEVYVQYESSTTEGDTGSSAAAIGGNVSIEKAENSDDRKELNGEAEIKQIEIARGEDSHGCSQQPIMLAPQMAKDSESTYPIAKYSSIEVSKQIELDVQQYERSKAESGEADCSVAGICDDVSIEKADSSLDSDDSMELDEGDLDSAERFKISCLAARYRGLLVEWRGFLNDAKQRVKHLEGMCDEANRFRDIENKYEAAVNVATEIAHTVQEEIKSSENAYVKADTAVTQLAAVLKDTPDIRDERVLISYLMAADTAMKKAINSHTLCPALTAMEKCIRLGFQ